MFPSIIGRATTRSARSAPWLICLDLQREHVVPGRASYAAASGDVVAACARVLEKARTDRWRVVHSQRRRTGDGMFGAPIEDLRPRVTEPVFLRRCLSAFSDPDFAAELGDALGEEVYLIGFSLADTCLATVLAAVDHGLTLTLVEDAVGAGPAASETCRAVLKPFSRMVWSHDIAERAAEFVS